jgi:hypothetical protein
MIRTLRFSLAALALALPALSVSAHAQFGAYGMFTATRMTGVTSSPVLNILSPAPCSGSVTVNCTSYSNAVNPLGFTGGAFYEFKTLGPATLAVDLRGSTVRSKHGAQTLAEGAGAHIYSGLAGLRASFNTPYNPLKAYVQGSAGVGRSNYGVLTNDVFNGTTYPTTTTYPGIPTQTGFEYHVYAGADLRFVPWADWRVFEVGYGGLHTSGTYAHDYPLYSISTGVVFRFPPRP